MESPLARIREERGYTTRSLAQRLGISPNTISEIERGVTIPNADAKWFKIYRAGSFGCIIQMQDGEIRDTKLG